MNTNLCVSVTETRYRRNFREEEEEKNRDSQNFVSDLVRQKWQALNYTNKKKKERRGRRGEKCRVFCGPRETWATRHHLTLYTPLSLHNWFRKDLKSSAVWQKQNYKGQTYFISFFSPLILNCGIEKEEEEKKEGKE